MALWQVIRDITGAVVYQDHDRAQYNTTTLQHLIDPIFDDIWAQFIYPGSQYNIIHYTYNKYIKSNRLVITKRYKIIIKVLFLCKSKTNIILVFVLREFCPVLRGYTRLLLNDDYKD